MTDYPTFTLWLKGVEALLGDITDIIADADMLGALRLWYSKSWTPDDVASALQDELAGL